MIFTLSCFLGYSSRTAGTFGWCCLCVFPYLWVFIFHESMKPANGKKSGAQFCISPFLSHQFGVEIHWRSILNFMRNALRSNDGFQSDIFLYLYIIAFCIKHFERKCRLVSIARRFPLAFKKSTPDIIPKLPEVT